MEIKRGRFFVIEGPDGAGKATQTRLLAKRLISEGLRVNKMEFPQYGKNIFGETITAYLSGFFGNPININPYLASLFYAGDRFKAREIIKQALKEGEIVLTDRYTSASMGHQGAKIVDLKERENYLEWLRRIEYGEDGFNLPKPDVVILLYVPPEITLELSSRRHHISGQERDGHETDRNYVERVAETFVNISKRDPTWRIVNCVDDNGKLLSEEQIQEKVWTVIQPFLPNF